MAELQRSRDRIDVDKPKRKQEGGLRNNKIPGHILQTKEITSKAKEIFSIIYRFKKFTPSNYFIASILGYSEETVRQTLCLMEEKGYCHSNHQRKNKRKIILNLPDPPKGTHSDGLLIDSLIMDEFNKSSHRLVAAVEIAFPNSRNGWKAWKVGMSKRVYLYNKSLLKGDGILRKLKEEIRIKPKVLTPLVTQGFRTPIPRFSHLLSKELGKDILGNYSSLSKDKEDKKLDKPTSVNGEFSKNEFPNETSCSSKDDETISFKKQTSLATINNETILENLTIPNSETEKDKLMEDAAFETKPRLYELLDKVSTKPKPKKKKPHRKCQELEEMLICFPKLPKVKITENSYLKCAKVIKDLENGLYETYGMEMVNLIASNLEETGITKSQVLKAFRNKYSKEERFELYSRLEKLKDPTYLPNLKQNGLNIGNALYNPHAMGIKSWLVYVMIKPPVKKLEWTDDELQQRNNALKQLKEAWENMNDDRIDNVLKWLHIHYKKDLVGKDGELGELCSGGFDKFISRYIAWMMVFYGNTVDKDDAIVNPGWLDKKSKPFRKFMETYKNYLDHLMECVR